MVFYKLPVCGENFGTRIELMRRICADLISVLSAQSALSVFYLPFFANKKAPQAGLKCGFKLEYYLQL